MHDQSGRFVDHDDMLIFVHDIQFHRFRLKSLVFRRALRQNDDLLVAIGGHVAFGNFSIDGHETGFQPQLQAAARVLRHQLGDDFIEAVAAGVRRQFQCNRGHFLEDVVGGKIAVKRLFGGMVRKGVKRGVSQIRLRS